MSQNLSSAAVMIGALRVKRVKMIRSLFSEQRNEVEIVDETLGKTKKKMKPKLKGDKFDS